VASDGGAGAIFLWGVHPIDNCESSVLVKSECEEPLNILVVDDELAVTSALKVLLSRFGHSVDVVHDGADALVRLRELPSHYQIVIVDHFMSKVTGVQFMVELPVNTFKGKIIVLSGYLNLELEAKYRALGVDRIMRKPFDVEELRQAVEKWKP
jgi:CheY-like chemotaxis protein